MSLSKNDTFTPYAFRLVAMDSVALHCERPSGDEEKRHLAARPSFNLCLSMGDSRANLPPYPYAA